MSIRTYFEEPSSLLCAFVRSLCTISPFLLYQSSFICASCERRSQTQNTTLKIFADAIPQNLFMTIYYNLLFLQAHLSQICARRQKILLMSHVVYVFLNATYAYCFCLSVRNLQNNRRRCANCVSS